MFPPRSLEIVAAPSGVLHRHSPLGGEIRALHDAPWPSEIFAGPGHLLVLRFVVRCQREKEGRTGR